MEQVKANELRIGNFIYDEEKALCKIIGFQPFEHSTRCDEAEGCEILVDIFPPDGKIKRGYMVSTKEASYISISPSLLEACGFETPGHSTVQRLIIDYADTDYPCTLQVSGSGIQVCRSGIGTICPEIKYLHQLQNLVHILTGTELSINLEKVKV